MSRLPDGRRGAVIGGYANGYGDSGYTSPYERSDDGVSQPESRSSRPQFRPRDRRVGGYGAGGYGGYGTVSSREDLVAEEEPSRVQRPTSLERSQAKRRSGGSGSPYDRQSPSRRRQDQPGDGSKQIEDVLRYVQRDWEFMMDDNCIPVQVALQFMDSSSLGLASRYPRFRELHQQLQSGLRAIVNEHHQGFNSSIGTFHSITAAIQTSQQRLRALKDSMTETKINLATTKPELQGLAAASQNYDDMLLIISSIEQLQAIPEKLEARISEKRFLSAVDVLQDALKSIRKPNMDEIGALSDLRVYLSNQEASLTDILVEELHNHLYLKSPYCENRWKQYASSHVKGMPSDGRAAAPIGGRQLYHFLDQLDTSSAAQDDPTKNPEGDTFVYINLLVESLNRLNRLDMAVETITHRLPVELFRVVEKCSIEVDQRYPSGLRGGKTSETALDFNNGARTAVLNDLFDTLYARFEAIAEGHRVVHEVISGIIKREGLRGSSSSITGGFRELWKLYQSEIRSLLHDYLATDGDLAFRSGQDGTRGSNIFKKPARDKNKKMFKLADMDNKSSNLTTEKEDLDFILKSSVPGLVSDAKRPEFLDQSNNTSSGDGGATGHKLVVEPSVFNMAILLPPSLNFLNRLKDVVPPSSDIAMSTLTSFLDDFLINVFLPQLDETIVESSTQIFVEPDAFQQDPQWSLHSKKPVFRGTTKFFHLIEAFCKILDSLPHDQIFSQLIISQIIAYYDRCYGWYKALVTRTQPHPDTGKHLRLAAAMNDEGDLKDVVEELLNGDVENKSELISKETDILLKVVTSTKIEEMDLILDRRKIASLCLLHTSMKWLASKMMQLRHISNQVMSSSRHEAARIASKRRWTLIAIQKSTNTDQVYLPLNQETAAAFDGGHASYLQLASTALRLLHVEIRGHIMYYVKRSMGNSFKLDQVLNEPDREVVALNSDIVGFDEEIATHLQSKQQLFISTGLGHLLDAMLVSFATAIPFMNAAGCGRLQLNILVLQQNLKNVEPDAQLRRSALYFDMFGSGPEAIIKLAKEKGKDLGFTYPEMKALLELCYSDGLSSERRELSTAAKRGLEDHILQLSEFLW